VKRRRTKLLIKFKVKAAICKIKKEKTDTCFSKHILGHISGRKK